MIEGITVDAMPVLPYQTIAIDQRTDQQEQGALRHVEVGDDGINEPILETWSNQNLRGCDQRLLMCGIEMLQDGFERFDERKCMLLLVWLPLMYDELIALKVWMLVQLLSSII